MGYFLDSEEIFEPSYVIFFLDSYLLTISRYSLKCPKPSSVMNYFPSFFRTRKICLIQHCNELFPGLKTYLGHNTIMSQNFLQAQYCTEQFLEVRTFILLELFSRPQILEPSIVVNYFFASENFLDPVM